TGLNIAALLDLWRRTAEPEARLHIVSIEGFPLSRDEAVRALSAWPELAEAAAALTAAWPAGTPGFHRLDLPGFNATLDLAVGDAEWALNQWRGAADAWFLDGFSLSTNPGMWSEAVLDGVAARSAPGAAVATFTVAGMVRRGLAARGFVVEKRPGHGRKRERLEARLPGVRIESPAPTVAVIGAGIAGVSAARALTALGLRAVVIEAETAGAGASGFPAALVTPRMDAGDRAIAALYAQALERAKALYAATPDAVIAQGVLQLEQAPRDAARFTKIAAQALWPVAAMTVVDAASASAQAGEPVDAGGLKMEGAMAARPAAVLDAWLADAERITAHVAALRPESARWRLLDETGQIILEADSVILASGWGAAALLADLAPELPLSPVRGQADWVEVSDDAPVSPMAWGGYVVPTGQGLLFGATHDRGRTDTAPSAEDSDRNRAVLAARLPKLAERIADTPSRSRAAVRATTPDRLPVVGAVPDAPGLYLLGGFGSRGFCAAPLLAEHVAALIAEAPSPLAADLAARVSPDRFNAVRPTQPAPVSDASSEALP
ncbi:MAG TPA: FAD-dependent 5-carboxymethylaminomethyl-2-thiouridine(34) oxidoreductase MnmC, partial [Brevundimonas sp.]|nr:FAD-dependent 5-carboxymethylaminomethyl-2-thiouridine(34) oxidoreductase MnmC [Brevundimonas sp.]